MHENMGKKLISSDLGYVANILNLYSTIHGLASEMAVNFDYDISVKCS